MLPFATDIIGVSIPVSKPPDKKENGLYCNIDLMQS